ncbi:carboxyvinyl-carboxyphosphonate phosphorylmutase [Pollutimonas bauzanensis]|uniref:Carboxyvinyl-carboxyphosphonate phosphorylmutase n=2 Tax=Pollutimonas bauzanensis TaxID=658167 RepID=A0A1M5YYS8_9BURK|nr:carboxyvinyl-carboxyphosphonate phosphorylmutase [Pollutimonas bauzanensis]
MAMTKTLKQMLNSGETLMVPGVGDALDALLVQKAGFPAVAISGYAVAASLGYPDIGLVTMSETVDRAAQICRTVNIPVIADADNGYGNPLNVRRTVGELETAGAAGFYIEDQCFPKRCGGLPGVELVSTREMSARLRAAQDARRNPDTVIIGRTDAFNSKEGFDDALRRALIYKDAGADVIMVHGLRTVEELRRARSIIPGPMMLTIGSRTDIPIETLREIGIQIVMYSLTLLRTGIVAKRDRLNELQRNGGIDHDANNMIPMTDLHELVGARAYGELSDSYADGKEC